MNIGHTARRNNIVFATKLVLLVYTMLIAVPLLQNWLYFGKKLACGWMLMLSVCLFITDRKHYKTKEYLAMGLFCVSYGITIILNRQNYFMNEVLILGFVISQYFMLTYCDESRSQEDVKKELRYLAYAMVVISFVFSVINLVIYFAVYTGVMSVDRGSYFYGIVGSQLGGIYNPNTGGTINYISMVFTLFLLKDARKDKIFLWPNLLIQLWSFSLVQSRGAWVSLLAFIVLYFVFVWDRESLGLVKKIAAKAVLMILCIGIVMGASKCILNTSLKVVVDILTHEECLGENCGHKEIDYAGKTDEEIIEIEKNEMQKNEGIVIGNRDMSNNGVSDITTGRAELWSIGFLGFCEKPMMGIGYRSIDDMLERGLSEYDYHNSGAGGLHNIYVTVLVSSGLVGEILFLAVVIMLLFKVLKIYLSKRVPVCIKFLVTLIPVWLVGDLVESRIMLSFSQMSVQFWIMAGYVLYYAKECEKVDQCDRSGL